MSSVSADSWVVRQRSIFKARRHIIRDVLFRLIAPLFIRLTVHGLEHVPPEGGAILMINHMTAVDPLIVVCTIKNRDVVPMSKIENFRNPIIGVLVRTWGGYAVHRGQVDRGALNTAANLVAAGEMTLIAPEGHRQPALGRPKDGLAYIATKTGALVIPVGVYNTEHWVRHLFMPWHRTPVEVAYGRPFRLRTGGRTRIPRDEIRRMTEEMMYQLASLLPERNRGDYSDLSRTTTTFLEFTDSSQPSQPAPPLTAP